MFFPIDTSVLVRLANASDAQHGAAVPAVLELHRRAERLHVTAQVLIEFRNVATRPKAMNGAGLPIVDVEGPRRGVLQAQASRPRPVSHSAVRPTPSSRSTLDRQPNSRSALAGSWRTSWVRMATPARLIAGAVARPRTRARPSTTYAAVAASQYGAERVGGRIPRARQSRPRNSRTPIRVAGATLYACPTAAGCAAAAIAQSATSVT